MNLFKAIKLQIMLHHENLIAAAKASKIGGILLIVIGSVLIYHVRRRRFNRRNPFGLETYQNFESATLNGCYNKFVGLLGSCCMFLGILLLLSGLFTRNLKDELPVADQQAVSHKAQDP